MARKKGTKRRNKSNKVKDFSKDKLQNSILGIFSNNPTKALNYKQISKNLNLRSEKQKQLVNSVLKELAEVKLLDEIARGKFKLKAQQGHIKGTVHMTTRGYAYISSDEFEEDIFVSNRNLKHALDNDIVKVFVYARKKGRNIEGEVIEVVERARKSFAGSIEISKNFAFVVPDSKRMPYDIFIPSEKINEAEDGQKVIAEITDWPEKAKNPYGKITKILGEPGENNTEMHAILAEYDLPWDFPERVEALAEKIPEKIENGEYEKRRDFRNTKTLTIDPKDAKDFDDAISFKELENGNYEIGVHIADVTHYIKPNTILDKEAYNRANSVYLVDRVVPMLPEKLSNKVCSLRPNEEKCTFSAVFEITGKAEVKNEWFGRTIIESNRRFTYEEAQEIIEGKNQKDSLKEEILILNNLAQILRKDRFKKGSIDLNRTEVQFEIDPFGVPLGVMVKEQKNANQLIEEFMLLANKKVAELFNPEKIKKKHPFVYRIHDMPNSDKLEQSNFIINKFGHKIDLSSNENIIESINSLITNVKGKPEQDLIETLILRSMAKAIYSSSNIGHYGLGFEHYTHFTSPIRRYPDMMVHRLLQNLLDKGNPKQKESLEKKCKHCSEMERLAVEAERASIKYKQVEFMKDKLGTVFEGVISGVSHMGLFVEIIENKCEGLVPIADLTDDFYEYDEDNLKLTGKRYKRTYQIGDGITIRVVRADLAKRQLNFVLE